MRCNAGRAFEAAVSGAVEARLHYGDDSDRATAVRLSYKEVLQSIC